MSNKRILTLVLATLAIAIVALGVAFTKHTVVVQNTTTTTETGTPQPTLGGEGDTNYTNLAAGTGSFPVTFTSTSQACNDASTTLAVFKNPFNATSTVDLAIVDFNVNNTVSLSTSSPLRLFAGTTTPSVLQTTPAGWNSYSVPGNTTSAPITGNASTTIANRTNLFGGLNVGQATSTATSLTLPYVTNLMTGISTSTQGTGLTGNIFQTGRYYLASSTPFDAGAGTWDGPFQNTATGALMTPTQYLSSDWGSTSPKFLVGPNEALIFAVDDQVNGWKVNGNQAGIARLDGVINGVNNLACKIKVRWTK